MTEASSDIRSPRTEPVRSARHRLDGDGWTALVLVAALVAMALVAGLNYTFSVAVMPNLAGADDRTFVATMQRFNENPVFQLTFAAALVLTVLALLLQRRHGSAVAVRWTIAALVLYAIVLAITLAVNVPLNDDIDRAGDPDRITDLAHVRDQFEGPWVAANIVRTVLAAAAVAALGVALLLHGRSPDRKAAASAGDPTASPAGAPPAGTRTAPPEMSVPSTPWVSGPSRPI